MRYLGLLALTMLALAPAAHAGVQEGEQAYLEGNYKKALEEIRPEAEAGDPRAQYLMGVMYAHGKGVERDNFEAARWYEKAARNGETRAAFNLGFMLLNGVGETNQSDPAAAAKWLSVAAQAGNLTAQYLLGEMYLTGRGVPRDLEAALTWTLRAALRGHARAQFNAGLIYGQRDRTSENLKEAYKWFKLAARQNYPGASTNAEIVAHQMYKEEIAEVEAKLRAWKPVP